MRIGVPTEIKDNEYRVGMTPSGASVLAADGHEVFVQAGAGNGSGFSDDEYKAAGAKILSDALGRPIRYQELPIAAMRQQSEDVALMYEWFDRVGYTIDRAALHREFPDVAFNNFETWARAQDWNALLQAT